MTMLLFYFLAYFPDWLDKYLVGVLFFFIIFFYFPDWLGVTVIANK